MKNPVQTSAIVKAINTWREYCHNGYDKTAALQSVHGLSYKSANSHCGNYFSSPVMIDAFDNYIKDSLPAIYKSKDGLTLEAIAIYDACKADKQYDTCLKGLRFIAEMQGHTQDPKQSGNTINIDLRSIVVNDSQAKSLIHNKLKDVGVKPIVKIPASGTGGGERKNGSPVA